MSQKKTARFEKFSERCPECGGIGTITRFYGGGFYESTIDCEHCRGRGALGNCTSCGGAGLMKGEDADECLDCLGSGSIGNCTHCSGIGWLRSEAGQDADAECPHCDGFGFVRE